MLTKNVVDFGTAGDEVGNKLSASASHPSLSATVKVIGLDLDGTMMPSYKTLKAIDHAHESLMKNSGLSSEEANKFISEYLHVYSFQTLLHRPGRTLEALNKFAKDKNIEVPPDVFKAVAALHKQAFTAYQGLKEVLQLAKREGVPVFIYTNSPDFFAVKRLVAAGIDPEEHGVVALWAKKDKEHEPLSWLNDRSTAAEKKWSETIIPYSYQKPNDTPLREMAALAGVKPQEILFIGEGSKDVQSAFCDPNNPAAAFCLQVQGARDICRIQQDTNERLRPGAEPLGLQAVEKSIKDLGVDNKSILRLERGFPELYELIVSGKLNLSAPAHTPYVSNRVLTVDKPNGPANKLNPSTQSCTGSGYLPVLIPGVSGA